MNSWLRAIGSNTALCSLPRGWNGTGVESEKSGEWTLFILYDLSVVKLSKRCLASRILLPVTPGEGAMLARHDTILV